MAIINKYKQVLTKMWRKGNTSIWLVGIQIGIATLKISQKPKKELPFDPAIPLLGLYLKNPKTPIKKF